MSKAKRRQGASSGVTPPPRPAAQRGRALAFFRELPMDEARSARLLEDRILGLRREGLSCAEVARIVKVQLHQVYYCMRKHGLQGKIRAKGGDRRRGRNRTPRITTPERVLESHDVLTIERGAAGGYLVTLDDKHAGMEQSTVARAIRSALCAEQERRIQAREGQ